MTSAASTRPWRVLPVPSWAAACRTPEPPNPRLSIWVATLLAALGGCQSAAPVRPAVAPVVLVCEHGNVKSLIGASLFDEVASQRGLPFRAVSRGVTPEVSVPPKIAAALRGEGIDVANFKPQRLTSLDVSGALRVVAIGVDLTSFSAAAHAPIEEWVDVPPASIDYAAARAALLRHIDALLDSLQAKQ